MGFVALCSSETNFENPLRIDKVIIRNLVYNFFGTQSISTSGKCNVLNDLTCDS